MKFLLKDDKTGKSSDTTLRTWIVFFLVVFYLIVLSILSVFSPDSLRPLQMDIIQWLIVFYVTVGSLYLGKRINENLNSKKRILGEFLNRFQEPEGSDSIARDVKSKQL
ncbi:hypothetical protein LEP1GSC132_0946 [Leptospira kirschneri str. 200803703]|uniref:Uncharacterized protein n=1 Tax=Leptospira kirschneri str. 200802841 TaxID=1193047 RepID=A0A828Y9J6_9LEPT|nr:hypothetical protein [Leptospira kirschneri]EMO78359.1 hypothetical protein LEP1GSC127_2034 [Leptospira kirschneri str. 200801925]EKO53520.1 hypothetical protein LEP1GSC131_3773 [Leptospira kirschneri str. 200802841]EMK18522.1 hypothetical protein LEP1GSC042_3230 [Leptospira kirschneri serovar Bim str. PUO 1247]EMN06547.1 hypothetical protein LEP1GSC046_2266 [Leptospira kirschneri serovar Bim str. 1051]EMN25197.1 hypothetical protein LEP1GSC065_1976 [Leptospira kirschneri serovar Sokoine st